MEKLHQWEARPSARATPAVDHRLRLWTVMAGLLLLPGVWLTRHPAQRRRVFRQGAGVATLLLSLCFVGTVFIWVRGYRATDVVTLSPYRIYRIVSGRGGLFLECLRVERMERTVEIAFSPRSPLQVMPLSDYVSSPLDIAESQHALQRRTANLQTLRWSAGRWERRAYPLGDRRWNRQVAWTEPGNAMLPGITTMSFSFSLGIIGNGAIRHETEEHTVGRALWLPYWLLMLLTSAGPILLFRRHAAWRRRKKRAKLNLCLTCGYDLHGTPERCPECGTMKTATPTNGVAAER